ncbi:MAG TPA: DinB family protein [Bryobacteraceae bacterium]|nr:DinB family protein [Bryobacteraceae bacterium]
MNFEPWLRGPLEGVDPLVAPTLHAYAQAREDLAHWTEGLTDAQIWARPHGLAPVGFQLRHIAGSVERLTAYLQGLALTGQQLEAIQHEMDPGASREDLLHAVNESLSRSEAVIRALDPAALREKREVGRKHLPTTVVGLVVHLAEHTQRHVGEAIITAKLARAA